MHYAGWRRGAVGPTTDGRWRCRLTIDRDRIRAPAVTIPPAAAAAGRLMSCTHCQHLHCCCAMRIYTPSDVVETRFRARSVTSPLISATSMLYIICLPYNTRTWELFTPTTIVLHFSGPGRATGPLCVSGQVKSSSL